MKRGNFFKKKVLSEFLPAWLISMLTYVAPKILDVILDLVIGDREKNMVFSVKVHKDYMGEFKGYLSSTERISFSGLDDAVFFRTAEKAQLIADRLEIMYNKNAPSQKYALFVEPVFLYTKNKRTKYISGISVEEEKIANAIYNSLSN